MIGKLACVCGVLSLVLSAPAVPQAAPANTQAGIAPEVRPEVVQVRCIFSAGSAFYVGPRTLVSVAHVTDNAGCRINGQPVNVIWRKGDFSILRVERPVGKWLRIDCNGFVKGRTYTAWGYARALPTLTSVNVVSTGEIRHGFARLWDVFNVIPGQSGGPFIDNTTGKVPGTVNVYNAAFGDSGSLELKGTILCS